MKRLCKHKVVTSACKLCETKATKYTHICGICYKSTTWADIDGCGFCDNVVCEKCMVICGRHKHCGGRFCCDICSKCLKVKCRVCTIACNKCRICKDCGTTCYCGKSACGCIKCGLCDILICHPEFEGDWCPKTCHRCEIVMCEACNAAHMKCLSIKLLVFEHILPQTILCDINQLIL